LACRHPERGAEAVGRILGESPAAEVETAVLDLADLASVRAFSEDLAGKDDRLDLLVNNAGVMAIPHRQTADGFEMQFGTNHLGHFALTGRLFDMLAAAPGARVVTLSSIAARVGRIRFDDLQGERHYGKWTAYGQSKLANQLFTLELSRRLRAGGTEVASVAAHPGYAATNLQMVAPQMSGSALGERLNRLANTAFAQSAADGALPTLFAATAPEVVDGRHYGPDRLFGVRGHPTTVTFARGARNPVTARRLWDVSADLTGVRFDRLAGGG
jgi:NAD(P)-dependent dehydrogenase (short-subunit alcohol dehydrogenase family)